MAARTTGKALIDFWQSALVENAVSARTAADLATACREVLGAHTDGENLNVRTCPVKDLLVQYAEARPQMRPQTLAAYKSRFKKAVRLFLAYQDDPGHWSELVKGQVSPVKQQTLNLHNYVFPLREGAVLLLDLPLDLSESEARRLSLFIESLVIPSDLS